MGRYEDADFSGFPPYVSVEERRRRAQAAIAKMRKAGHELFPVEISTRQLTTSFWGQAWCKNLEAYSDFSNRLPRGRSYLRHGAVIDLKIEACGVRALVNGSELYTVSITIERLPQKDWATIKQQCARELGSVVELLQGSLSKKVMERVTSKGDGLFPSPREISWKCSCPDWAGMCKHAAATFYGIGARLDHQPELLFTLRDVDPNEMIEAAVAGPALARRGDPRRTGGGRVLQSTELSSIFGVDIELDPAKVPSAHKSPRKKRTSRNNVGAKNEPSKNNGTSKKAASKKAASKKAASKKAASKKAASKKAASRKGAGVKKR